MQVFFAGVCRIEVPSQRLDCPIVIFVLPLFQCDEEFFVAPDAAAVVRGCRADGFDELRRRCIGGRGGYVDLKAINIQFRKIALVQQGSLHLIALQIYG